MNLSISTDTLVCLSIIVVAFIVCLILVLKFKNSEKMEANRRIIEYFPTLVSTLGVLGTFWGITKGLMAFDTSNLDQSIPGLLDGLKTAFFTSLAGMIGSIFLSAFISKKQDERDGGISDINQAAGEITKSVKAMSDANTETIRSIQQQLTEQEADRKAFYRTVGEVMSKISDTQKSITSAIDSLVVLQRSQENSLADIKEATTQQSVAINSVAKYSQEVSEYTHHLGEILDVISGMSGTEDEINEKVGKLKEIIHGEVIEIEDNMAKTNKLLESKFDEFTELLKKSNTEALVEVMKKVTEEFQKQMNSLINKLIQENFDQLNKSVEKLNQWQQENKEMIASLTHQYKEMSDNFEATSTSLTRVKDDTASLVSEGGKLRQLVDALNQVIIEDEHFIEVTKELHETARSNMESFNESTKTLNEWVRKQRNFVDGVQLLIAKLEELNKIRDYGEQFWKGTKDKMEEGVGILTRGSQTLNSQLTSLDRQFYGRLSATLAELDNCITKMVEQVGKRR